jgi:endogenous inhibitor of DNA gyrase (YacG/DUF329 family)
LLNGDESEVTVIEVVHASKYKGQTYQQFCEVCTTTVRWLFEDGKVVRGAYSGDQTPCIFVPCPTCNQPVVTALNSGVVKDAAK